MWPPAPWPEGTGSGGYVRGHNGWRTDRQPSRTWCYALRVSRLPASSTTCSSWSTSKGLASVRTARLESRFAKARVSVLLLAVTRTKAWREES